MSNPGVIQKHVFICCFSLHIIFSFLLGSSFSVGEDLASKINAAQRSEPGNAVLPLESSLSSETVKPALIRNRRSNFLLDKEHLNGNNAGLDSAFLYSDQIMQNLLNSPPSKPLGYAHSNFFLNYLKPRTTRYNAWDDHSLMHFGKRSSENDIVAEKVLVKRSADFMSPNNVLHFGKKSENVFKGDDSPENTADIEIDDIDSDTNVKAKDSDISDTDVEKEHSEKYNIKKSTEPWHSMMSFGKKSQAPWDYNTLHFGKKADSLLNELTSNKRLDNFWDHNTMHFGKRDEPWHSMMSFGKKSDNFWDHNTLHFGKKDEPWHNIMSFGKRFENPWDHNTLHFGKRDEWDHNTLHFGKRDPWDHNTLHFGKRDPWDHNTLHFGKRDDPWHHMMSFGKRPDNLWDHNTLHFGKRDDPWHHMMSFGKKSENSDMTDLEKREDPWHNMMSFGKKFDGLWNNSITMLDKRDEPWHSMMSFGKKSGSPWDHNTLHFGKKDEPWHSMMSFGKRSPWDHNTLHFGKKDEPWHSMMSFGKKSENPWDHNTLHFGKKDEPWHSMMSFGKRSGNPWDHNTLHFGKKDEPWHSMMSFGKKSENPWDHNTLHFGKKDEPWHSMMSFGKKSDPLSAEMNLPSEIGDYPWNNMMNFDKRSDGSMNDLSEDFSRNYDPWYDYDGMIFYKKSNPWDHNTLHFGKKSNATLESLLPAEKVNLNRIKKRSTDSWNDHHTMHFGKKFDPWESPNTMHFGKKSDFSEENNPRNFENEKEFNSLKDAERINKKFDWDSHNTMHFGKRDPEDINSFQFDKRDPWDYHNTMHFGKRNPWDYHNTMHFGKRDPWDSYNTMHFGKRDPWDYHNTMHFGKREPWDYHNTMHFGKREPWDYHNTMHFGKKSDLALKDKNSFSTDKIVGQMEDESSNAEKAKDTSDKRSDTEELSISKRSSSNVETKDRSSDKKIVNEGPDETSDNHNFRSQKQPLANSKSTSKINKSVKNDKIDYSLIASKREIKDTKSTITQKLSMQDHFEKNNNPQVSGKISHIQKRSVKPSSFIGNRNEDSNSNIVIPDSKDYISDAVLHFGKRSVEVPDDREDPWFDRENEKRFDDFWNDHNTLHFGKKSDIWDNHNTLHFGKKSDPQEVYSVMPSSKRDPWEYLNTLHFGKKFDPWAGHSQMHFGKRTDNWDQLGVMHFGKRKELTSGENSALSSFDDFDQDQIRDSEQSIELGQDYKAEDNDILANLVMLKSIINSNSDGDSLPFEERVNLLRRYLKPILKAIIDAGGLDLIPFSEQNDGSNERVKEGNGEILEEARVMPYKRINEVRYGEDMLEKGNEDSSYGEYGDNSKKSNSVDSSENLVKTKRKYLGKADLKRYFVPFQGPKSIVYPHAWFASQIRRSSFPRTTDYARHMEMRMAEKKEDPFNSYMHFGRR